MPTDTPKLAILSPILPTAPLVGGTIHIVEEIRQLAQAYALDFYALAQPSAEAWPELRTLCTTVTIYARTPSKGLSLDPPAVQMEHSAPLLGALKRAWSRQPPAIVQIEFTTMMQYAPLARQYGAQVVCTAHNVAYLAQIRRARREPSLPLRARRWVGALSLWLYELRALRHCDLVITHNPEEAATLRRWLPSTRVEYIPSGVNLADWPVCFNPTAEHEVLFVGSYQHPPNVEGALWLARDVWPLVRRERPNARLTLAGRAPPPEVQALAAADIRVPGTLADLRPLYARASVFVAPIFWGGGVRIKLIEALAAGMPIVTTKLAAEGIDLQHERTALFAEAPDVFASAIVRLLDDSALRAKLGAAGRALAEREYDWEAIGQRLIALYQQASR